MANNLYVVGLPYETTPMELEKLFSTCGKVSHAKVIRDKVTGRSKGFGFVEMTTAAEAQVAIQKLNGSTLGHRQISITEAKPAENRSGGVAEKPGFVERRSGLKDRRRSSGGFGGGDKRNAFGEAKKWNDKPRYAGAKKWERKPDSFGGSDKRGGFGETKKWEDKPRFGKPKKWERKPDSSGAGDKRGALGEIKKWGDKPRFGGEKKWESKPGGLSGGKKRYGKPGSFNRGKE